MRAHKLLILCFLFLCSCMQHNGYIGDWFGTWHLESITVDGVEDAAYQGNYFFQFQADKVRISEVNPSYPENVRECFGSWEASGDVLELNFSYTGVGQYWTPWPETYLPPAVNFLEINKMTNKRLTLTLSLPDKTVIYQLRKQ